MIIAFILQGRRLTYQIDVSDNLAPTAKQGEYRISIRFHAERGEYYRHRNILRLFLDEGMIPCSEDGKFENIVYRDRDKLLIKYRS